jgi:hypothetical protein
MTLNLGKSAVQLRVAKHSLMRQPYFMSDNIWGCQLATG